MRSMPLPDAKTLYAVVINSNNAVTHMNTDLFIKILYYNIRLFTNSITAVARISMLMAITAIRPSVEGETVL